MLNSRCYRARGRNDSLVGDSEPSPSYRGVRPPANPYAALEYMPLVTAASKSKMETGTHQVARGTAESPSSGQIPISKLFSTTSAHSTTPQGTPVGHEPSPVCQSPIPNTALSCPSAGKAPRTSKRGRMRGRRLYCTRRETSHVNCARVASVTGG